MAVVLCALACTGEAAESTRHAFSHATEDECFIRQIWQNVETRLVSAIELACIDGDVTYPKKREVGDTEANWPTLQWDDARRGDLVVCKLAHVPFGKNFWIVERVFRECYRVPRAATSAQKK
jgi:hypothetical protein